MKTFFKILWKVYNVFVMIVGHLTVICGLTALGYYLHLKNMLYLVLVAIIILLLIIIAITTFLLKRSRRIGHGIKK